MGSQWPSDPNWRWDGREWVDSRRPRRSRRPLVAAGTLVVLVVGGLLVAASLRGSSPSSPAARVAGASTPSAAASAAARPTPAATASARPPSTPAPAPATATGVDSVALAATAGSCQPGASCALEVTVGFPLTTAPQDFAWTIQATDSCTGATSSLGQSHVTAEAGWNRVIGDLTVSVPAARGGVKLVAITSTPGQAASAPLQVGAEAC